MLVWHRKSSFTIYETKVGELEMEFGEWINSLSVRTDGGFVEEFSHSSDDELNYHFSDLKLINSIKYRNLLQKRGVNLDYVRADLTRAIRQSSEDLSDSEIETIVENFLERDISIEHHLGILKINDSIYLVAPSNDFESVIKKVTELSKVLPSNFEVDNFPDFLVWLVKKQRQKEIVGGFNINEVRDLVAIEDKGSYTDDHTSLGPKLTQSLAAMYKLYKSQYVSEMAIVLNSTSKNLGCEITLLSDFPKNSKTFNMNVKNNGLTLPPSSYTFIRSLRSMNKVWASVLKKVFSIVAVVDLFMKDAKIQYNSEAGQWASIEKKQFLEQIAKEVKNDLPK